MKQDEGDGMGTLEQSFQGIISGCKLRLQNNADFSKLFIAISF